MRFDVITLFPEIFSGYLSQSILKHALDRRLVEIHLHQLRDWASGPHKQVDDRPFGGGPGMVLMPGPVFAAVESVQALAEPPGELVLLTPQGGRLDQALVRELAGFRRLVLLCGRYEGFDERIRIGLKPREVSIGDYVLNGGEVAAMVVIDAVIRLVPGVLGHAASHVEESFGEGGLLEYPQYTRPREFRGMSVPEVLVSGDHGAVAEWRRQQALARTRERRPGWGGAQRPSETGPCENRSASGPEKALKKGLPMDRGTVSATAL